MFYWQSLVVFVTDSMGSAVLEYLGNIQTAAHWLSQIFHKCGSWWYHLLQLCLKYLSPSWYFTTTSFQFHSMSHWKSKSLLEGTSFYSQLWILLSEISQIFWYSQICSMFMEWDLELYDPATNQPAKCNSSDLNEELGQVRRTTFFLLFVLIQCFCLKIGFSWIKGIFKNTKMFVKNSILNKGMHRIMEN